MQVSQVLPFLAKAPVLHAEQRMVHPDELFFPYPLDLYLPHDLEARPKLLEGLQQRLDGGVVCYDVDPLGLMILRGTGVQAAWLKRKGEPFLATVYLVDYGEVAEAIDLVGDVQAYYPEANGFLVQDVASSVLVEAARDDRVPSDAELVAAGQVLSSLLQAASMGDAASVLDSLPLTEAFFNMDPDVVGASSKVASNSAQVDPDSKIDMADSVLTNYLVRDTRSEKIPLLLGGTGVAKSALVKEVAARQGFRVVDVRAAFLDRVDFNGLAQRVISDSQAGEFTYDAYMAQMMECTDEFLDMAAKVAEEFRVEIDRLSSQAYRDDQLKLIQGMRAALQPGDSVAARAVAEAERELDLLDKDRLPTLRKKRAAYLELAKPAVLFFDEITRGAPSVLNALIKMNEQRFFTYSMRRSKVLAATNFPIAVNEREPLDPPDEWVEMFATTEVESQAFLDRFIPIPVAPKDVMPRWKRWASGLKTETAIDAGGRPQYDELGFAKRGQAYRANGDPATNIHPLVLSYLEAHPDEVYDVEPITQEYHRLEATDAEPKIAGYTTAFPNYRTWELLSNYLYQQEHKFFADLSGDPNAPDFVVSGNDPNAETPDGPGGRIPVLARKKATNLPTQKNVKKVPTIQFLSAAVTGLVGQKSGEAFCKFLVEQKSPKWGEFTPKPGKVMDSLLRDAFGTPVLLMGPSSIGKTSRIANLADEIGAEFIEIQLSQRARVDIMGSPVATKLDAYVGDKIKDKALLAKIAAHREEANLPERVTVRAPNASIAQQFQTAMEAGRPIVLFFDEVNRVADRSISSAVFEAVSDHRIFGIDFSDYAHMVAIFCACNIGDGGTEDMDPAYAARFLIWRQDGYTNEDAEAMLAYMAKQGKSDRDKRVGRQPCHPALLDWLTDMHKAGKLVDMIASVEQRSLQRAVPSMRSIQELNAEIQNVDKNTSLTGVMLFSRPDVEKAWTSLVSSRDAADLKGVWEGIRPYLKGWAALGAKAGDGTPLRIVCKRTGQQTGERYAAEDLVLGYEQLDAKLKDPNVLNRSADLAKYVSYAYDLLQWMQQLEVEVSTLREKYLEGFVGDETSRNFLAVYNQVSGTKYTRLTLDDLVVLENVAPFVAQELGTLVTAQDRINKAVGLWSEVQDKVADKLPQENLQALLYGLETTVSPQGDPSAVRPFLKQLVAPALDKLVDKTIGMDVPFLRKVALAGGLSTAKIDELVARKSGTGTASLIKPRILKVN